MRNRRNRWKSCSLRRKTRNPLSVLRLPAKYRDAVLKEQLKLNRITESTVSLYTAAAVLGKIDNRLQSGTGRETPSKRETETARFYIDLALDRLDDSLDRLLAHNRDREIDNLSKLLTGTDLS
jgi:hypothetical protein